MADFIPKHFVRVYYSGSCILNRIIASDALFSAHEGEEALLGFLGLYQKVKVISVRTYPMPKVVGQDGQNVVTEIEIQKVA